ncbi:MAG: hypothetical protein ACOYM8_01585 [Caulobacterales bacterium]|jgi:hypothetical protein
MILFGWHVWRGESGRRYRFKITLTKAGIPPDGVSGVYVFVRRRFAFFLEPLYVGKATSFRERLLGHEKWGKAFWFYGATERHVCRIQDVRDREVAEEDLIRGLKPPMNDMMVPRGAKDKPVHAELRQKRGWWPFGAQNGSAHA